jgi:hypothetical protein
MSVPCRTRWRPTIRQPFLASEPQTSDIVRQSRHAQVREFAELWEAKRGERPLPLRDDFPFEELAPWFGHVLIMDVIDGGRDFRYRMIGTAITEFLDRDYSGRLVSECDYGEGDARSRVAETFRQPVIDGRPVFRSGYVVWAADKTWRTYDSVHCPLSRDGGAVELTIGVLYFGSVAAPSPPGATYRAPGAGYDGDGRL